VLTVALNHRKEKAEIRVESPRLIDATRAESLINPVTSVSLSTSPNFKFEREKLLKQAEILWPIGGSSREDQQTIRDYNS
jgi:hypothetical protein